MREDKAYRLAALKGTEGDRVALPNLCSFHRAVRAIAGIEIPSQSQK